MTSINRDKAADWSAQNKFANYVQETSFNLSLSRHMVSLLQLIRDGYTINDITNRKATITPRANSHWVPLMGTLERRGLVIYQPRPVDQEVGGWMTWRLSKAGLIVCDLLVEAELMPARKTTRRRKAA